MPPTGKKNHTITVVTFALMIAVALFYDGAQAAVSGLHALPFVGNAIAWLGTTIIDLYALLTFFVWFKIKGVSFANPKRGLTMAGATLIELIPVLNVVPAWTLAVVICVITTRGEEMLGEALEKVGAAAGAVGTVAGVASKIPMVPPGLKQGLSATSKAAKGISESAKEARSELGKMSGSDQAGFDKATKRKDTGARASTTGIPEEQAARRAAAGGQVSGGARDTGVKQPPAPVPEAAPPPDIGGQPVFRQTPQAAAEPQEPLPAETPAPSTSAQAAPSPQTPPAVPPGQAGAAPATGPVAQGAAQPAPPASPAPNAQGTPQSEGTPAAQQNAPQKPQQGGKQAGSPAQRQGVAPPPLPRTNAAAQAPQTASGEIAADGISPSEPSPQELPPAKGSTVESGTEHQQGPAAGAGRPTPRKAMPVDSGARSPKGGYSRFRKPADFAGLGAKAPARRSLGEGGEEYMRNRAELVRDQAAEKLKAQGREVAEKIRRGEKLDDKPDDSVSLSA